jgi:anti-anti-sigma regulatory factor
MEMTGNWLTLDEARIAQELREAGGRLSRTETEMVLDFSGVRRIDPCAVRALEELAVIADEKGAKVGLNGVNVDVYKVLKLLKLASRFSFVHRPAPSPGAGAGDQ